MKAPLSAANLADSSAVRLASEAARSSSASKMMSFFLDAASPAAVRGAAMAETGLRGEWDDGDDDRSLHGRDRRSGAGTLDAGDDRRGLTEERDVDAAAAEATAERDMVTAAWKLEMERGFGGGRPIRKERSPCSRRNRDGRPDRGGPLPLGLSTWTHSFGAAAQEKSSSDLGQLFFF